MIPIAVPANRFQIAARDYTLAELASILRWNSRKPAVVEFIANLLEKAQ